MYRALERLRVAEWVDYEWGAAHPEPGKPRRRFYWLTEKGRVEAPALLAERRRGGKPRGLPGLALVSLLVLGGGVR